MGLADLPHNGKQKRRLRDSSDPYMAAPLTWIVALSWFHLGLGCWQPLAVSVMIPRGGRNKAISDISA